MDEARQAQVRRYNRNIETAGGAVIMFGLWAVVRFLITLAMGSSKGVEYFKAYYSSEPSDEDLLLTIVIFIVIFSIFIALYLIIGLSAIRYANGKKKKRGFAYCAIIVAVLTLLTLPMYFVDDIPSETIDTILASLLTDVTLVAILFDMARSTFKRDKLLKMVSQEQ